MVKKTRGRKPKVDKGKESISSPPTKRGQKSRKEFMEPLIQTFAKDTPCSLKSRIFGWETEATNKMEEEDELTAEELQHMIDDPGHTRGRISLFQHSIRTYWFIKCVLVKAIMSIQEKWEPNLVSTLTEINRNIQEMLVLEKWTNI